MKTPMASRPGARRGILAGFSLPPAGHRVELPRSAGGTGDETGRPSHRGGRPSLVALFPGAAVEDDRPCVRGVTRPERLLLRSRFCDACCGGRLEARASAATRIGPVHPITTRCPLTHPITTSGT